MSLRMKRGEKRRCTERKAYLDRTWNDEKAVFLLVEFNDERRKDGAEERKRASEIGSVWKRRKGTKKDERSHLLERRHVSGLVEL